MEIDNLSDIVIDFRMCSGVVDADELMNSLLTFPHDSKYQRVVS
jgi:hypothetical protein